jgi:ABC-type bacteriocin/lantibiotic exporter with double-glycine peptidase domain
MIFINPFLALMCICIYLPQIVVTILSQSWINAIVAERVLVMRRYSESVFVDVGSSGVDGKAEPRGMSDQVLSQLMRIIGTVFTLNMRAYWIKYVAHFLSNLLHNAGVAVALCLGGWLVIHNQAEVGAVVAFISGFAKIDQPWRDLIAWYRTYAVTAQKYDLIAANLNRGAAECTAFAPALNSAHSAESR